MSDWCDLFTRAAGQPVDAPAVAAAIVQSPAAPTGPMARRASWRCPNPRDCGDPTCDGRCGY